jgi:hypothetical protein
MSMVVCMLDGPAV